MRHAGEFAALGTAVCWAIGSNLFAAAGQKMGSRALNRFRITVACALLAVTLWLTRGSPWPSWASREQIGWLSLSGLIGFVFGDLYFFRALVILGPGRATLIASSAPVFTALLAWPLLRETPGPLALLGMALTLGGIAWVMSDRLDGRSRHAEGSVFAGVVAGVLGALGQALGYVISKHALGTGIDPLSATVIRVAAAGIGVWVLALFQGSEGRSLEALRDRAAVYFMVGGAIFGPFLGVLLSLTALHYIDAGVAASIIACYPVLTILLSSRFHRERITLRVLAGALAAAVGVVVLFLR